MNFSPNLTRFLFFKKKYYSFLKNYKCTSNFRYKLYPQKGTLLKNHHKIIFIPQKNFIPIFVSELSIKLNFSLEKFKTFKKSNMLREKVKILSEKALDSVKKIFLFHFPVQMKNESGSEIKNLHMSKRNLLELNNITIFDSYLKLNVNPDIVQIALKTYKHRNFRASLSQFLNQIKNWSIKNINNYERVFFRKWKNFHYFFKKKVEIIFQLKYLSLNINSRIIKSIITKKSDKYQIKNYNLVYPMIKVNKKIANYPKSIEKLGNPIISIKYFFEKWEKFEKNTLFLNKNSFFPLLFNTTKNQLSYQRIKLLKSPDLQICGLLRNVNLLIPCIILRNFPFIRKIWVLLPIINLKSFYLFYEKFPPKLKKLDPALFNLLKNLQKLFLINNDHLVFWLDIQTLFRKIFQDFHELKKSGIKFLVFHSLSTHLNVFSLFLENSFIKIGLFRTNIFTIKNFDESERFLEKMISIHFLNFKCKRLVVKTPKFMYVIKKNYIKISFFLFLEIKSLISIYTLKRKLKLLFSSNCNLTKLLRFVKEKTLNRKILYSFLLDFKIVFSFHIHSTKFFDFLLIFKKSTNGLYRKYFDGKLQIERLFKRFLIESCIKSRIIKPIFVFQSFPKKFALNIKKLLSFTAINSYSPSMIKIKNIFILSKIDTCKNLMDSLKVKSNRLNSKKVSTRGSYSKFSKISSFINKLKIDGNF